LIPTDEELGLTSHGSLEAAAACIIAFSSLKLSSREFTLLVSNEVKLVHFAVAVVCIGGRLSGFCSSNRTCAAVAVAGIR